MQHLAKRYRKCRPPPAFRGNHEANSARDVLVLGWTQPMLRLPLLFALAPLAAALAPTRCLPSARRTRCLRCCELPSEATGSSPEETGQTETRKTEAQKPEATISLAQWMVGMNTSPRRIATATLSSTAIALAANFLGVTSGLLSLFPEVAREQRLDVAYPVGGFKRHLDPQGRYTFIFPVRYVADQTVYMRNADAAYTRRTQDPLLAASGLRSVAAHRPTP
jgi:hypothetical protein